MLLDYLIISLGPANTDPHYERVFLLDPQYQNPAVLRNKLPELSQSAEASGKHTGTLFFLFCFSVLKSSHSRGGNERIRLTQSRISLKNSLLTGTSSRSRQDSEHLWTLDLPHLRKLEWSKPKSDGLDTLQILLDDMFRHDSLEASGKKT